MGYSAREQTKGFEALRVGEFGLNAPALRLLIAELLNRFNNSCLQSLSIFPNAARCSLHSFSDEDQFAGKGPAYRERLLLSDRHHVLGEAIDVTPKACGEEEDRGDSKASHTQNAT